MENEIELFARSAQRGSCLVDVRIMILEQLQENQRMIEDESAQFHSLRTALWRRLKSGEELDDDVWCAVPEWLRKTMLALALQAPANRDA